MEQWRKVARSEAIIVDLEALVPQEDGTYSAFVWYPLTSTDTPTDSRYTFLPLVFGVFVKALLGMVLIRKGFSFQALPCKRTVEPFLLALSLRMPWPSMKCQDTQFHQPYFEPAIAEALGRSPRVSVVAEKAKW